MQQTHVLKDPLLLASVAFGASFFVSLLVNRDFNKAFLTGLITVPATICGVVVVSRKQLIHQKRNLTALQLQIRQFEQRELQMHQSLSAMTAEQQVIENDINALQAELNLLYVQTTQQRKYKEQLSQDLVTLLEQRRQMEAEANQWQTQIYNLEQRIGELDLSMRSLKAEKYKVESSFNSLQTQLSQLRVQTGEQHNSKKQLEQDLTFLKQLKPQLEVESYNLQTQIQELEKRKALLIQSLEAIAISKDTQTINQQNNNVKLEKAFPPKQRQLEEEREKQPKNIKDEWIEFVARLPHPELQVIKAIVGQDNPSATIKKIAEENITMPELLIESINERALATIGDLIIEPGSNPPVIAEAEYLINVKKMLDIQ